MTGDASRSVWLAAARAVVDRLSWPAEDQLSYLKDLGVEGSIDELGLEFDDVWLAVKPLLAASDEALLWRFEALDEALASDALRWDAESLQQSGRWREVRELARRASELIGGPSAHRSLEEGSQ